jgi:hypothetical protein
MGVVIDDIYAISHVFSHEKAEHDRTPSQGTLVPSEALASWRRNENKRPSSCWRLSTFPDQASADWDRVALFQSHLSTAHLFAWCSSSQSAGADRLWGFLCSWNDNSKGARFVPFPQLGPSPSSFGRRACSNRPENDAPRLSNARQYRVPPYETSPTPRLERFPRERIRPFRAPGSFASAERGLRDVSSNAQSQRQERRSFRLGRDNARLP